MSGIIDWRSVLRALSGFESPRSPGRASNFTPELLPFHIPVLLVSYFPLRNGNLNPNVTGDVDAPYPQIHAHTVRTTWRVIQALENGSAFHLYKNPLAISSLRYHIVDAIEFQEPMPTTTKPGHLVPMTDYTAIMDRIDIRRWVEDAHVKEIWIWGYHGGVIDLWESNMAGPFGDISNSDRDAQDLPVFDKTYTVYHYNYQRGPSEAVENHLHQIEAVLRHVDPDLFWNRFVGKPGEGRCGWSHFPPNGERDYDWQNPKKVWTDIEDWRPDGSGKKSQINCERWHGNSLCWFIYWMQNIPGAGNRLVHEGRPLSNWWTFIGDFDGAMGSKMRLA